MIVAQGPSAWNAGGSILTFYFPVGLFLVIAALLCLQFGRRHEVPGRKPLTLARSDQPRPGPGGGEPQVSRPDA